MEKLITSLKHLGLTRYEALSYIGLNKIITGQADEIAEISDVPRSKIYEILNGLESKGFVEIRRGRPLKYTVVAPNIIFQNEKEKLISEIDSTQEKLEEYYNDKISEVQAPVWLIHGEEKIIKKEISIIKNAKKTISIRLGFMLDDELKEVINTLKTIPKNVKINIIANRKCIIDNKTINITKEFKNTNLNNLKLIESQLPIVKLLIVDGEELFGTFAHFDDETNSINSQSAVGVCNQYKAICQNMENNFKKQFQKLTISS